MTQEFCHIVQKNVRDTFDANLLCWARAIIVYAKETQVNNTALQMVLRNVGEDPGMLLLLIMCYLRILFIFDCI